VKAATDGLELCNSGLDTGLSQGVKSERMTCPIQAKLVCFVATTEDLPENSLAAAMRQHTDLSCMLPADGSQAGRIVVGSLDLTVGTISSPQIHACCQTNSCTVAFLPLPHPLLPPKSVEVPSHSFPKKLGQTATQCCPETTPIPLLHLQA